VTVHYRWHPYFGRDVAVDRRVTRAHVLWTYCALADGTIGALPSWMMDAGACARLSSGAPEVSVSALVELRRVLDSIARPEAGRVPEGTGADRVVGPALPRRR